MWLVESSERPKSAISDKDTAERRLKKHREQFRLQVKMIRDSNLSVEVAQETAWCSSDTPAHPITGHFVMYRIRP